MPQKVIIWDNDGTILGSRNPNDASSSAKVILPNVERLMKKDNVINIICSGCKTPESEMQNFDPKIVIEKFEHLMKILPIQAATFSPAIGGVECYAILKKDPNKTVEIRKEHENSRYQHLIGQFKKPGIGMLAVIKDILKEDLNYHGGEIVMIGDTWHDRDAAKDAGIPFLEAQTIHSMRADEDLIWEERLPGI